MLIKKMLIATIPLSLMLSGCATTNSGNGAIIGAVTGAIAAKATGNHKKSRLIWGAAVGALAGAAIGEYMDRQELAFRQELAGSGIDIVREGDNLRLIMPSNITFATGKSSISHGFHLALNDVAKVLNKFDKTLLSIEGHTDNVGSEQSNQILSEQRAMSVKVYLMNQDILSSRLQTKGYGESAALVSNNTPENRALNRRVEIQIIPKKA